jgi:signal transduction histidine kinase/CheY-like chemotaxis protein
LNTISLSSRLLSDNLIKLRSQLLVFPQPPSPSPETSSSPLSLLEESLELLHDLEENSSVAVATLSDLLNYDKIETKTFIIEKGEVSVWSVLDKTIHPLVFQAKEKNIEMTLLTQLSHPQEFGEREEEWDEEGGRLKPLHLLENLCVVGDSVKLGQVIRNLVSNALKFTPPEGTVKITGPTFPCLTISFLTTFSPASVAHFAPHKFPLPSPHHPHRTSPNPSHHRPHSHSKVFLDLEEPPPSDESKTPIGSIIINVTDTGPGLTHEQQQMLFQEGVQFNPNELQAGQGSGLGLWIAKEIVLLHEGEISVNSLGPGEGTTFEVVLPVVYREGFMNRYSVRSRVGIAEKGNEGEEAQEERPGGEDQEGVKGTSEEGREAGWSSEGGIGRRKRNGASDAIRPSTETCLSVLVVDDAISNRKLVCRLLTSKGFLCQQAENGQQCLDMVMATMASAEVPQEERSEDQQVQRQSLEQQPERQPSERRPYDLILMDFEMPVMNGPTATRQIWEMGS